MKTDIIDVETGEIIDMDEAPAPRLPAVSSPPKPPVRSKADLPVTGFSKIAGAIAAVMKELTPVKKEGKHEHFNFKYAKMQDLMQELTPLMGQHGLAIIPTELEKSWVDKQYVSVRYAFTIIHESGEVWPERPEWTGMSLALTHKGGVDDKCLNKCATAARKYFLLALFNIPTADMDDADKGSSDAPRQPPKPTVAPKPVPGAKPHALPHDGMEMSHWVTLYIAYLSACASKEELVKWDGENDKYLTVISNKDKAAYDQIVQTTQRREKELAPKKPGPPAPPKMQQDKAVEPGEALEETVRDAPPSDVVDGQAWLKGFASALSGCDTPQALEEVRRTVGLPAKGKVSQEEWEQGGVLLQAAKNRIALEDK